MFSSTLSHICRRRAMNTLFEILVEGDDLENEMAAAEAALDEVTRIENILSRFDPASEVARVNREAQKHPVLISHELFEVVNICGSYWEKTLGYFDLTAGSGASGQKSNFQNVVVDSEARTIFFNAPQLRLDFGAFGKGFALDCAAQILKENGVKNALLHGGTSSVLAMGNPAKIALRNPWSDAQEIQNVTLCNAGLSSSATFHQGGKISDIIDPHRKLSLCEDAACVVIGGTASETEIYSTALLCMGKTKAEKFKAENLSSHLQVLWINQSQNKEAPICGRLFCSPSSKPNSNWHTAEILL